MADIDVELDRPYVPAYGAQVTADVTVTPGRRESDVQRQVAVCVDTSGSMSGPKMESVRDGLRWTLQYLKATDHVAIVGFDTEAETVLPATRLGELSEDDLERAVASLSADGGTDIHEGLSTAYAAVAGLPDGEDVVRRILLLTDGRDNSPPEEIAATVRQIRLEDDVSVAAAGVGEDYDELVVRAVGTESDGEWVHLEDPGDIEEFFSKEVEDLSSVVAAGPRLELDVHDAVEIAEAYLRQPQVQEVTPRGGEDGVRIDLPDLREFQGQEMVVGFRVPGSVCEVGRRVEVATVELVADEPVAETAVVVECSDDPEKLEAGDAEVGLKHMETKIRKTASEGDTETAAAVAEEAARTYGDADLAELETVIRETEAGGRAERYEATRVDGPAAGDRPGGENGDDGPSGERTDGGAGGRRGD